MIKNGVRLLGLQPQMVLAFLIIKQIFEKHGQEIVITSGSEGKHSSASSRHYSGYALDFRTRDMPTDADKQAAKREVAEALGGEFFVLLESTHLHVQYNGSSAG